MAGAIYQVMNRGDRCEDIFKDDHSRWNQGEEKLRRSVALPPFCVPLLNQGEVRRSAELAQYESCPLCGL